MKRRRFLATAGALPVGLASGAVRVGSQPLSSGSQQRTGSALVLGGGGARGAYEAGVIEGLRRRAGIGDGARLPGVDVVCGTSIGTLNAWYLATGDFSGLRELWATIGSEPVFVLKRQFAALANPHAFVLTKIVQALSLAQGLTKNVQGVLDGGKVAQWLERHVDPLTPLVVPFVFTATNLDRERAEIFYRLPFVATPAETSAAAGRLRSSVGLATDVRLATNDLLRPAMRASTAIPVLFDPVALPSHGGFDRYVDGGIADNDPIDVGRALALSVHAVLADPAVPAREPYRNALEIRVGAFGVAQRRILEASLRSAYLETRGKRLFTRRAVTLEQRAFNEQILDANLYTMRPARELPVEVVEFDRQAKVSQAYDLGVRDAEAGWRPYVLDDPSSGAAALPGP